jgi:hypothetical protein
VLSVEVSSCSKVLLPLAREVLLLLQAVLRPEGEVGWSQQQQQQQQQQQGVKSAGEEGEEGDSRKRKAKAAAQVGRWLAATLSFLPACVGVCSPLLCPGSGVDWLLVGVEHPSVTPVAYIPTPRAQPLCTNMCLSVCLSAGGCTRSVEGSAGCLHAVC